MGQSTRLREMQPDHEGVDFAGFKVTTDSSEDWPEAEELISDLTQVEL